MEDIYSVGQLVKMLKINKETIRYYEKIGLLSEPKKNDNGYRIYNKADLDRISFIIIVKGFGFSLKEIKFILITMYDDILGKDSKSINTLIDAKLRDINKKIEELAVTKKLLEKVKSNVDNNRCSISNRT